jgi:hypothetical protein
MGPVVFTLPDPPDGADHGAAADLLASGATGDAVTARSHRDRMGHLPADREKR